MAKVKYYYDTETCQYIPAKLTAKEITLRLLGISGISVALAGLFLLLYQHYFPSDRELSLQQENQELLLKYDILTKQMGEVSQMLTSLQERDDKVYRVIFEAEPIAMEIRKGGTGGVEKYRDLLDEKLKREELIVSTFQRLDNLKRQMYIQTKSYDELIQKAKQKSKMLASIPAIQPVSNKGLSSFASGFGMRVHPIYKVRKMHTGCDFTAPKGTPIYATGDGTVRLANWDGGYGMSVEIDHGFGYVSKYAHLSAYAVRPGQKVKRGQKIGAVGSTGTSVSPHLHYEIIYNRQKVNPVNYFFNDLSPAQYQKMLEIASEDRQSLGGGNED